MTAPDASAGRGRTTIAAIAVEVGVSVATVSKVLNGRADVAPETRARVEASLERHQYRRRTPSRPISDGQVEIALSEFNSAWSTEIVCGVEIVATSVNVSMALSQLGGRHRPTQQWLDGVLAREPLGVLFVQCGPTRPQQQQLRQRSISFVVVDSDSVTSGSVPTVGSNNWNGGLLAARHLLELGHRRIAAISGPQDVLCSQARLAGFRFAHDEAGLAVDTELVRYGNFYVDAGYKHAMELLSRSDRPTAIFAGSDLQAMGVLRAARLLGLDVPGELSVVGYDNLPLATWTTPALTTVNQPLRDMAGTATRMLLDLARGKELPTSRIDLVTELVVRESTAPLADH